MNESHSRLSKSLLAILTEKSCISYFIQFLETKNAIPMIKFWLDVENFRTAAEFTNRSNRSYNKIDSNVSMTTTSMHRKRMIKRSVSSEGYDSLSVDYCDSISENSIVSENNSCDIDDSDSRCEYNLDNISEHTINKKLAYSQSLTDDEKTQQMCENKFKKPVNATATTISNTDDISNSNLSQSTINSDAVGIYKKYLITNSSYHIDLPAIILSNISLALCGTTADANGNTCTSTCPDDVSQQQQQSGGSNQISSNIFTDAQQFVYEILEHTYMNAYFDSLFYCKYTKEILASDNINIYDILNNESALFYFMEYLEQLNKHIYLEFWLTATNYKKLFDIDIMTLENNNIDKDNYKGSPNKVSQNDAVVIYDKYFSLQATNSLNLSDRVRYDIEENICSKDNTCNSIQHCFNKAIRIIEIYLEKNYFQYFISSNLFSKYLSELNNKTFSISTGDDDYINNKTANLNVLTEEEGPGVNKINRHRKTYSDCTNDKVFGKNGYAKKIVVKNSISCQNTLLAMESNCRNKIKNNSTTDMLIDFRHFNNPDLLWYRKKNDMIKATGLRFGSVDALGRYKRDFEAYDSINSENGNGDISGSFNSMTEKWSLKKAVRKLVNLQEDKAQEELAWQVAEMIVKDITDITLCTSKIT